MPEPAGPAPDTGLTGFGWVLVLGWTALLTTVILRPIAHSGYGLGHDLVFTPQQPLDAASIGVSSASPRAVPVDGLVALLEHVTGGSLLFRLALVLPLLAAGIGSVLALRPRRLAGGLACAGFSIWNPFVVERLAIGQWALLWAYAALPWLLVAVRQPWRRRAALTIVAVGAASITPTGGLIAGALALLLTFGCPEPGRPRRRASVLGLAGAVVLLQLPWVLPSLLSAASGTSDPAAVSAFASRADGGAGLVGSLLTGAGIWNADVVPGSRAGRLALVALGVVLVGAAIGWRALSDRLGSRVMAVLGAAASGGLVLAALARLPGGAGLLRAAVRTVPGAGLLRDGQKWVLPLVLMSALLVGAAAELMSARLRQPSWRASLAVGFAVVPILLLPDGAVTVAPTVRPVHYPSDWAQVRRLSATGGDAVVLPFAAYRTFAWAPGRPVLDPAPRLLATPVVVDDRLSVSGRLLAGEDPRGRAVAGVLARQGDIATGLARIGVSWVVVEHGTPGPLAGLGGLRPIFEGPDVSLYAVPAAATSPSPRVWRVAVVAVVDVAALAGIVLAALVLASCAGRRRRSRDTRPPDLPLLESPTPD